MKTIPMQVDGEAVRVNPAVIEISFLNQAKMLVKRKGGSKVIYLSVYNYVYLL